MDGVVLCHLANHIRPRSVASIHVPSPAVVSHFAHFFAHFAHLFCIITENKFLKLSAKKVTSNIYCISWLIPRFDFFQEALNKAQKFSSRAIFMYWVYIICVLVCVLAAVAEFASVMNSAFTIRWLYLWNLSSFLYSLNSVWQSAEEMLRTFWMLVKNWAFHRYSNCLND